MYSVYIILPSLPQNHSTMDSSPKTSRIPKFGSGLRKALFRGSGNGNSKSSSANSTPQGGGGSANLGRSKSMRVSRSVTPQYKIIKPSSSLDNDDDEEEVVPVIVTSLRLPTPRTRLGSRSQPNSRPNSPYIDSSASNLTDSSGSNDSQKHQQLPDANITRSEPSFQRNVRSKSFGAKNLVRPRSANNRSRAGSIQHPSEPPNSPGLVPRFSTGNHTGSETESTDGNTISLAYAGNLLRPKHQRRSPGSRPSSMIITQETSDLNQLASELSRYEGNSRDGRSPGCEIHVCTNNSLSGLQCLMLGLRPSTSSMFNQESSRSMCI